MGDKSLWPWLWQCFPESDTKSTIMMTTTEIEKLDFIKIKDFVDQSTLFLEWKNNPQNRRKYLLILYVINVLHAEYIKNSYNLTMKRQITHTENSNKHFSRPGMVAQVCNPSTLGGWGRWITWGQEFKTSLANTVKPRLY